MHFGKFENEFMKKLNLFTLIFSLSLLFGAVIPAYALSCRPSHQSKLYAQADLRSEASIFILISIDEVNYFVEGSKICNSIKFESKHVFDEKSINLNEISFCIGGEFSKNLSRADLQQELDGVSLWNTYLLGWEKDRLSIIGVTNKPPLKGTFEDINFSSEYRFIYSSCFGYFTKPILNEEQKLPIKQIVDEFQSTLSSIRNSKIIDK